MGLGPGLTTHELDGRGRPISTAIIYDAVTVLRELEPLSPLGFTLAAA